MRIYSQKKYNTTFARLQINRFLCIEENKNINIDYIFPLMKSSNQVNELSGIKLTFLLCSMNFYIEEVFLRVVRGTSQRIPDIQSTRSIVATYQNILGPTK